MLSSIPLITVLIAAVLGFFVGAVWYSKLLFGPVWLKEMGLTEEECKQKSHNKLIFVYCFLYSLISAFALAYFLGSEPSFFQAVGLSLLISIGWIATAQGINDLFSGRSLRLSLIDAGYHVVRFLVYGIVLGALRL